MSADRGCEWCKHAGADPDGPFCGHPASIKATSGFGYSWATAANPGGICNPGYKLFEKCTCNRKECPRHG